jgi:hypothetical protein
MQSVASTHPSSTCLQRNICDGATCTTRWRTSSSLQTGLKNSSQTCFHVNQAAKSRRVSRADLTPSVLWRNRQTETHLVLRPKPKNHRHQFWDQTGENCRYRFWGQIGKNRLSGFEAKPLTNHRHRFWGPNRWETVDLGFEAQPRNLLSSSPHARCRSHTVPPDLSIARPPSTQPVRPSPVLCTRSPTLAMILVAARHATPATCTLWDKQTRFSKWNKDKTKTKQNYPGFEFKHHQVNDSSQSNQGTDHLVSQSQRHTRAQSNHNASTKTRPIPSHSHPNHLIKRGSQIACIRKLSYHDSCTLCKGSILYPWVVISSLVKLL